MRRKLIIGGAVIGGLLIEPSAFYEVASILKKEHFYDERNQAIFEAMFALANEHKPIDYLTVSDQLQKDGNLEKIGGKVALTELSDKISSAVNIESYAEIVAQKYLARELIRVSTEIQTEAYDTQTDVVDLIADTERKIFEVTQTNVRQDAVQVNEVIKDVIDKIQLASVNKGNYTGVPSGFPKLDDMQKCMMDFFFFLYILLRFWLDNHIFHLLNNYFHLKHKQVLGTQE